jgi:hypothetical protein
MGEARAVYMESLPQVNEAGIRVPVSLTFRPVDDSLLDECIRRAQKELNMKNYIGPLNELLIQLVPIVLEVITGKTK